MRRKESSPVKTGHEKVSVFKGFCGWLERLPTGQRPVMLHTHEVTGSSPVVSTKPLKHLEFQGFFLFLRKKLDRMPEIHFLRKA